MNCLNEKLFCFARLNNLSSLFTVNKKLFSIIRRIKKFKIGKLLNKRKKPEALFLGSLIFSINWNTELEKFCSCSTPRSCKNNGIM